MTVFALQDGPRTQRIDLGDGLVMRWSTRADADDVGELLVEAFRWEPLGPPTPEGEVPPPNNSVGDSGRRLLRDNSAVMTKYDFAVAENTAAKQGDCWLIACVCLHAVPGYYGSISLQYGKPEVIATHPDYRNRGLIRRLFLEMIHPASDDRGDLIQFIFRIPHFYLQFGYTYALRTGEQRSKSPSLDLVPKLPPDEKEPFILRQVSLADIRYLIRMSTRDKLHRHNTQLGLDFDEAYWRFTPHDVFEAEQSVFDATRQTSIVEKDIGVTVYSFTRDWQWDLFTLEDGISFHKAVFPVLRGMIAHAKDRYDNPDEPPEASFINHLIDGLGPLHPASQILAPLMQPDVFDRLYTRIPSYPRFLRRVAPVLEERLAKSALAGISANLCLDFFRKVEGSSGRGLKMSIKEGKILSVEDWVPQTPQERMLEARKRIQENISGQRQKNTELIEEHAASFAPLSFTRLVTGEIAVDQMLEQYGESFVKNAESRLLLSILFPKVEHHFVSLWW
ncbi:hypothetical protein EDD11_006211 [Mortierella claussenii]|nr:hypothetical protein EDD11_006211 [Mortierella claussenii]